MEQPEITPDTHLGISGQFSTAMAGRERFPLFSPFCGTMTVKLR
jgi:hypothetical protein